MSPLAEATTRPLTLLTPLPTSGTNVTLNHKTCLKFLGYICSNSQKYIVWVKKIDFYLMPKIIRIVKIMFHEYIL